jgi:hypothetical protein
MIEILGRRYEVRRGSDVERDGMYLEIADDANARLADVFYSDQDNSMTFTAYRADLPLPVVEWLIAQARLRLTPIDLNDR